MTYRLPDGRQVQKKLGPAWTERGRPPTGYFTKHLAEDALRRTLDEARPGADGQRLPAAPPGSAGHGGAPERLGTCARRARPCLIATTGRATNTGGLASEMGCARTGARGRLRL